MKKTLVLLAGIAVLFGFVLIGCDVPLGGLGDTPTATMPWDILYFD